MSQTIDNRIVEMQFENKQFESGVQESLSTLDKLKNALKFDDASKNLQDFSKNINKNVDLSGLSKSVEEVSSRFSASGIAGMEVIRKLTDFAIEAGKTIAHALDAPFAQIRQGGWKRAMNIEDAKFQLKGLGIAWETVSDDINYAVADTAYGLDVAAKACSQLSASGIQAGKDMKAALRGISGVASMGNTEYENIAQIFTKAAGNGKVMADELNRISQYGLNARAEVVKFFNDVNSGAEKVEKLEIPEYIQKNVKALTKGTQMAEADLADFVKKGKLDFETFSYAMDYAFGEHAKAANETFMGSLRNIKAALSKIGAEFATPIIHGAVPIFNEIRIFLNDLRKRMGPVFEVFKNITEMISNKLTDRLHRFALAFNDLGGAVHIGNALKNVFTSVVKIITAIANAFNTVFPPATGFEHKIMNITEAIENFSKHLVISDEAIVVFRNVLVVLFNILKGVINVVKTILPIVGKVAVVIMNIVNAVLKLIACLTTLVSRLGIVQRIMDAIRASGGLFSFVVEKIKDAFLYLRDVLSDTSTVTGQFFQKFKTVVSSIALIVGGVLYVAFMKIRELFSYFDTHDPLGSLLSGLNKLKDLPVVKTVIGGIELAFAAVGFAISKVIGLVKDFVNNLKSGMSVAKAFGTTIVTALGGVVSTLGGLVDKIKTGVTGLFESFSKDKVIEETIETPIANANTALVGMEKTLTKTGTATKNLTTAFDRGYGTLRDYQYEVANTKTGLEKAKDAMAKFGAKVLEKVRTIKVGQVLLFAFSTTVITLTLNLAKLVKSMTGVTDGVKGIIENFKDLGKKKSTFLDAMLGIALGITALTAAIYTMSQIPADKLQQVVVSLGALLTVIGLFSVLSKDKSSGFALAMASFSGSVLMLVAALYALNQIKTNDIKDLWVRFGILAAIMGTMAVISAIMAKIAPEMTKGAISMLALAGSIYVLAKALDIVSKANLKNISNNWQGLTIVILAFAAFASIASNVGMMAAMSLISFLVVLKLLISNAEILKKIFGDLDNAFQYIGDVAKSAVRYVYNGLKVAAEEMAKSEALAWTIGSSAAAIIVGLTSIILAIGHAGKGMKKAAVGFAIIIAAIAGLMYATVKIAELSQSVDPTALVNATSMLQTVFKFILLLGVLTSNIEIGKVSLKSSTESIKQMRKLLTSMGLLVLAIGAFAAMTGTLTADEMSRVKGLLEEVIILVGIIAGVIAIVTAVASKGGKSEVSFGTFVGIVLLLGSLIGSIAVLMFMFSTIDWEKDKAMLIAVGAAFVAITTAIILILAQIAKIEKAKAEQDPKNVRKTMWSCAAIIGAIGLLIVYMNKEFSGNGGWKEAAKYAALLVGCLGAIMVMVLALEGFSKKFLNTQIRQQAFDKTLKAVKSMIWGIVAFGAIFLGLKALGANTYDMLAQAGILIGCLSTIVLLVTEIQRFSKDTKYTFTKKSSENFNKTMRYIGLAILAIGGLALIFAKISDVNAANMAGQAATLILTLYALSALVLGIERFMKKANVKNILKVEGTIGVMMAAFAALALIFKFIIDKFDSSAGELLKKSQVIMLALGELALLVYAINKFMAKAKITNIAQVEALLLAMVGIFAVLALIFKYIINDMVDPKGMLAKSQIIMLALYELAGLMTLCGVISKLGWGIAGGEVALIAMVGIFAALTQVFKVINNLKTEGVMAKSQTIILVLTELMALIAVCGLLAELIIPGMIGGLGLLEMVGIFAILVQVFKVIDGLKTEGIMKKSQTIILVLTELCGLSVLSILSVIALVGGIGLTAMVGIFALLTQVFTVIDGMKTDGLLAKSQTIILVLTELCGLSVLSILSVLALVGGPGLTAMVGIFGQLTQVFTVIDGLHLEGLREKAHVIILILLELEGLSVISILGAIALAGGPGLEAMVDIFGKLSMVFLIIDQMHLEGLEEKADIIVNTLLKLEGLSALGGIIGGAFGTGLLILAEGIQAIGVACATIGNGVFVFAESLDRLVISVNNLVSTGPGIRTWFTDVSLGVMTAVTTISTSIMGITASIVVSVNMLITGIATAIRNGKAILFGEASDLSTSIKKGFDSKLKPLEWGKELVAMFASGMSSGLGSVAKAAASVAHTVWRYLHFSGGPDIGDIAGKALEFFGLEGAQTYAQGWLNGKGSVGEAVGGITSMISDTFGNFDVSGMLDVSNLMSGKEGVIGDISDVLRAIGILKSEMASINSLGHGTRDDFLYQLQQEERQLKKNGERLQKVAKIESDMGKVTSLTTNEVKQNNKALEENAKKQKELAEGAEKAATGVEDFSKSLGGLEDAGKGAKGSTKEVSDEIANFYDSIEGAINLFEEFNKQTELTSDKLLENMRSQISGVSEWADQIQKLAFMGIDQGLLQELADMGPQGYEYTNAFVHMTAEQLAEANNLYHQSLMLPSKITSQVYGSYTVAGRNAASGFLQGLQKEDIKSAAVNFAHQVVNQMNIALDIQSGKSMVTYKDGVAIVDGVKTGITEGNMGKATDLLISNDIKKKFNDGLLNNNYMYTVGKNITKGLANGVGDADASNDLVGAVIKVCNLAKTTAEKATKEKSPSRVFMKIGNFITLGLAKGISDETQAAVDAMDTTANTIIDTMRDTINKANEALINDVDEPVITPILDLSEIQNGSRELDSMLSRNSAFSASRSFSNLQNEQWNSQNALLNATMDNSDVVGAINGLQEDVLSLKDAMTNIKMVLDTGTMVGAMTPAIDQQLGMRQVLAGRGI